MPFSMSGVRGLLAFQVLPNGWLNAKENVCSGVVVPLAGFHFIYVLRVAKGDKLFQKIISPKHQGLSQQLQDFSEKPYLFQRQNTTSDPARLP